MTKTKILTKLDKKQIVLIATVLIIMAGFILVVIPECRAGWLSDVEDKIMSAILEPLETFASTIGIMPETVAWIFTGDGGARYTAVANNGGIIGTCLGVTAGIAAGLVFVYTMIKVIHEAAEGPNVGTGIFVKIGAKFLVSMLFIIFSGTIISYISKAGTLLITEYTDAIKSSCNPVVASIQDQINKVRESKNVFENLAMFVNLMVNSIVMYATVAIMQGWSKLIGAVITFALTFTSFGLLIELNIRKIFMPFAIVGTMTESERNPAIKYLKKYFAVYLRVGMYMVAIGIGQNIALQTVADLFKEILYGGGLLALIVAAFLYPLQYIIIMIAALSAGKKGGEIIDQALGTM